jgi:hypothetical protein
MRNIIIINNDNNNQQQQPKTTTEITTNSAGDGLQACSREDHAQAAKQDYTTDTAVQCYYAY